MTPKTRIPHLLALSLLVAGAQAAHADKIYRTDGRVIEDVKIQEETLIEVAYKKGNTRSTIPSEEVLRVEFERMPRLVDEAMGFLVEDDLVAAVDNLDEYVDTQIEKKSERNYKWAPAFAAWKTIEIRMQVADLPGVTRAAQRLIDNFPDSRYLPGAFLAKADAELQAGKGANAQKTLSGFSDLIDGRGLSQRWRLECRLAQTRADDTKSGDEKRKELGLIITESSSKYPTVTSRARVAEGESYLVEAERTNDRAKAKDLREKARGDFQRIVDDPAADDGTLAGAYAGLGDCLFYLGAETDDMALLRQASMHYLRVVTLYEGESRYVPRSLFYAMRCFEMMQDRRRMTDMKRELAALFPNSRWTAEAQKF